MYPSRSASTWYRGSSFGTSLATAVTKPNVKAVEQSSARSPRRTRRRSLRILRRGFGRAAVERLRRSTEAAILARRGRRPRLAGTADFRSGGERVGILLHDRLGERAPGHPHVCRGLSKEHVGLGVVLRRVGVDLSLQLADVLGDRRPERALGQPRCVGEEAAEGL